MLLEGSPRRIPLDITVPMFPTLAVEILLGLLKSYGVSGLLEKKWRINIISNSFKRKWGNWIAVAL